MKSLYVIYCNVSCGQRYNLTSFSEDENQRAYGDLYSPEGLGHNLRFEVELQSSEKNATVLQKEVSKRLSFLDHQFLNEDIEVFRQQAPSAEALAFHAFEHLQKESLFVCRRVRVYEGVNLWGEYSEKTGFRIGKEYKLNCVHRHHNPELSESENATLYGKCSRVHGHEYKFEVQLQKLGKEALLQPWNVLIMHRDLDEVVDQHLLQKFDKKYLNEDVGNTSGEIICRTFFDILRPQIEAVYDLQIHLRETRKNSFLYSKNKDL